MPEKPTKPTKPGEWGKEDVLELPSGNVVRVRRPLLYVWMKTGQLSKETAETYRKSANDEKPTLDERWDAMNEVLCKCVVEPEWTLAPRDGSLHIDEVCDSDRAWLAMRLLVSL